MRHREVPFVVSATAMLFHLERHFRTSDGRNHRSPYPPTDRHQHAYVHERYRNLTAAQTAMLRAVADGEYRLNSATVVRKYELGSAQTITRNKRILTERDFIAKEGEQYVFSDPVFELWFRREYC